MENATKALVIAGAVLVTILLISVGIKVFNTAKEPTEEMNAESYKIDQFNSSFNEYLGDRVDGSNVRSLLNAIRSSNATHEDHEVTVSEDGGSASSTIPANNGYKSSKYYKVTATYGEDEGNKGYIISIDITDV